jgi:predicted amidophosphoribosyltransferase
MVHLLKYEGIEAPAAVLAREMSLLLPTGVTALVPVPRAAARKVRYGSDPALSLARLLGSSTGLPVVRSLAAPLWWPAHAGTTRAKRTHPRFRNLGTAPIGSVLVDDVLTTGATVSAAAAVSGIRHAITATRAGRGSWM